MVGGSQVMTAQASRTVVRKLGAVGVELGRPPHARSFLKDVNAYELTRR
jgi:hypothetical protein